ncbi:cell envelope integrity protein TolA [Desulfobotulus mexicanus]|uniref:cell envelope integrity protein TolA n=1 Tax=Desulfobotulus mexicanus TaxID=2586642 RepID=UPI0015D1A16D|nr:cell envelope integrity protein TolA [Desulfobotulus mexicanus]
MAKKPVKKKTTTSPASEDSAKKKNSTAKKTSTAKKNTAATKAKTTAKTSTAKTAATTKMDPVLFRKFDDWKPATPFQPVLTTQTTPSAPPFCNTSDPEEAKRIAALLLKPFSPQDFILSPEKKAEQEARFKAQEEERIKAKEEARKKAEEEAIIKAEEEARKKAEEEARIKAEEEARKKAEEEARIKAEEEARKKAEEEARIKAEEEARKKAEEEARIKAEEEARIRAIKAEEARKQAEEAARIRAEEEARIQAEEEKARLLAEKKARSEAIVKNMLTAGACIAAIFVLIIGSSISNKSQYFIKTNKDSIEIWQGAFSPRGKNHILTLPGVTGPEVAKEAYTRSEVMPLAFNFYMDKAIEESRKRGTPDFDKVEKLLKKAQSFASSQDERQAVAARLQAITKTIENYKAEIANP